MKHLSFIFFFWVFAVSAHASDTKNIMGGNALKTVALLNVSTQYDDHIIPYVTKALKSKGYAVTTKYLKQFPFQDLGYSNTERVRAETLLDALLDPDIDIIWFVRGGGGGLNILPYLHNNVHLLKQAKPKILVGFSDITALHMFVNDALGWQSVHGTLASANTHVYKNARMTRKGLTNDREPLADIPRLYRDGTTYDTIIPLNDSAKTGINAPVLGGNLTLISATFSTHFEPDWAGKILLIEDVGISFRQLDRSLHQILFKKEFNIKGVIFGQTFSAYASTETILAHKITLTRFAEKLGKPVYYYPVMGHGRKNHPLILNAQTTITCTDTQDYCTLKQPPINQK